MKRPFFLLSLLLVIFSCSKKTTDNMSSTTPDAPFSNTRWKLAKLPGVELPQMNDVVIRFDAAKNHASGNAGCNRFSGQYSSSGKLVKLGPLASTKMMCSPEVMPVEDAFLKALSAADNFLISGDKMQLKKSGTLLAEFEALYL